MVLRYLLTLFLVVASIGFIGCTIRTPEIQGVVLDEETKQPVEGVWITSTLGIKTKTIGGEVHKYLSVEMPHTRTDKSGKFIIPPKRFKKPFFPIGFGTVVESFGAGASTVDDRGGSLNLIGFLGKRKADVTIYAKPDHTQDTEGEYFTYLQGLYNYCLTGRFYVEVPPVEEGCDEWELNYTIAKYERYLEKYKDPKIIDQPPYGVSKWDKIHKYSAILKDLAYLYKKKGDYKNALILFKRVKDFDERHGSSFSIKEYESQMRELHQKLEGVKK